MKNTILITLILFSLGQAKADYISRKLYTLVLGSEVIIEGEVICVDDQVFELRVKNSIDFQDTTIAIKKFKDWTCGVRWSEYFVGQKLFVFLRKKENEYMAFGGGNEGEMPVIDKTVYISSIALHHRFEGLKIIYPLPEHAKADSPYYEGYAMGVKEFWDYILYIRNCFEVELSQNRRVRNPKFLDSIDTLKILSDKSSIYDWTFKALIK